MTLHPLTTATDEKKVCKTIFAVMLAGLPAGCAAVGGASAGAWGLVRGNDAGKRALAGAGAAAGTVHGSMQSTESSPVFRNFVRKCLNKRGYEVIGWQ
ncbi:MAG: hypothetical protein ABFS22_03240 [Pseudomonadota bacterium]